MITTITGNNVYLITNFEKQKKREYKDKYGDLAVEVIDCEEASFARIIDAIQSLPFLVTSKLVVLKNPSLRKEFTDKFEQSIKEIPDNIEVIIIEPKPDKRSKYYKSLKTMTTVEEFAELDNFMLTKWLNEEAKKRGGKLELQNTRFLIERVGNNQQKLSNELDKLITHKPFIDKEDIIDLTVMSPQSTIFELVEKSLMGDTKRAIKLYDQQRYQKVEPQQIIALLTWQLHVLAIVKTAGDRSPKEIAEESKLNPFVISKAQNLAKKLTYKQIKDNIAELFKLEVDIKTKSIDTDRALKGYIMGLNKE
ncbi:DNA polymerase III subunit delta [Candidatus Saccharibacteria bacterium]|nr:DNA polymerase III subunit delta [Candidatus Saccharibacteria bacterium]